MRTSPVSPFLAGSLRRRKSFRSLGLYSAIVILGILFIGIFHVGFHGRVPREDYRNRLKIREYVNSNETAKIKIDKTALWKSEKKQIKMEKESKPMLEQPLQSFLNTIQSHPNQFVKPSTILPDDQRAVTASWSSTVQDRRNPVTQDSKGLPRDLFKYFKFESSPFKDYSLSVQLSQTLPLDRLLPEFRPKQCLSRMYSPISNGTVSVIVPFYNEMWSVLLRTINSMLERSPPGVIREIILVDDYSNFPNLLAPLDNYMKSVPLVRLLRLESRQGLIRARMAGARLASGNILAFVDAHVEVTKGWLEPLIALIEQEPKTIAVPVINSIDPLTFEYKDSPFKSEGTFSWDLDFVWKDEMVQYETLGVEAHPTPTMIGCAFVVNRQFFFDVGAFDEGMNIWGGEQIEISFRTWMCGGAMKIVPCSHVGHIYRAHLPYVFDEFVLYRNLQRIAEVWMDDYKRYYYYTIRQDPLQFSPAEIKGVNERKELRKRLRCESFSWYLDHLVPHIKPPPTGSVLYGNIKNIGSQLCLYKKEGSIFDFREVAFNHCSLQLETFTFTFTDEGNIVYKGLCLTFTDKITFAVVLAPCDQTDHRQIWQYQPGLPEAYQPLVLGVDVKHAIGSFKLRYDNYSLCLSQILYNNVDIAGALPCVAMNSHQFWVFTYTLNFKRSFLNIYDKGGASIHE